VSRRIGIAASVATLLARDGWNVAADGWRPYDATMPWGSVSDDVAAISDRILAYSAQILFCEENLADVTAPARIFLAAEHALGPVNALVNVHAHSTRGGLLDTSVVEFDRHYAINARATFLLCSEFARRDSSHGGSIVNVVSAPPLLGEIAYAASKGAITWLTLSAAAELAPKRITVNAVDPGPNETGWMTEDVRRVIASRSPSHRIGTPLDAAELIVFLCSERASWITGQVMHADGGYSTLRT
jgi:3-oxoacyl-[acyl-carrier protein] reductase